MPTTPPTATRWTPGQTPKTPRAATRDATRQPLGVGTPRARRGRSHASRGASRRFHATALNHGCGFEPPGLSVCGRLAAPR